MERDDDENRGGGEGKAREKAEGAGGRDSWDGTGRAGNLKGVLVARDTGVEGE